MARKLYTKEQAAEMLVMSDDESDIDNLNDHTILEEGSDSDFDMDIHVHVREQSDEHSSHRPSHRPRSASFHRSYGHTTSLIAEDAADSCDWKLIGCDSDIQLPEFNFLGVPGLKSDSEECILSTTDDNEMIRKSFELFLTDELLCDLVNYTNIRADQYLEENIDDLKPHSRFKKWKETDMSEMKRFIGILLLMGVIKKPSLNEYWSTDPLISTPFFHSDSSLTRDRFLLLHHFIRFADYRHLGDDHDLLRKIRPFTNRIREIIGSVYNPSKNLTVDESLLLFKGRLVFKQYIPAKRSRFGIKIYLLCESDSGFMLNFEFHSSKNDHNLFAEHASTLSLSERIVVHLSERFLDQGHRVFADNWFSSARLASYLLSRSTYFTGTVRPNRGVPHVLSSSSTADKETRFATNGKLVVSKFCDKKSSGMKTVFIIDSCNKPALHSKERIVRGGERISVRKSSSMIDYNLSMGGVDRADQILHSYDATRKSYRWFLKVGVHLIQRLCLNAFIVYRNYGGKHSFEQYLMCCSRFLTQAENPTNSVSVLGKRTCDQHFPSKIEPRGQSLCPTKRCRVCYNNGKSKRSSYVCARCPGNPGLCSSPCFEQFHCK